MCTSAIIGLEHVCIIEDVDNQGSNNRDLTVCVQIEVERVE